MPLNHSSACSKLACYSAILSRSLEARGEISTRKAMSFPEELLRLFDGDSFAVSELFNPLPDCGHAFGALQSVKQRLITAGILDYHFSPTVDR